jgi:hypothetical protein
MLRSFWFARQLRFPRVFGFHECFQAGKAGAPETAVLFQPGVYGTERFWVQLVDAKAAFTVFAHQMRAAQEAQVLRDGRARDGKGSGDLSSGLAAAAQEVENSPAGGIGQGLEGGLGDSGPCRSG